MNKVSQTLIVATVLALSVATNVVAEDDVVHASAETVKEFTEMCVSWANDDGVDNEDLYDYVLKCVNDELESEGYHTVTTVNIE
jgi:hypothetical protein